METFYPDYEAKAEINAKAVFVDLDETFLDGTVIDMTDEELLSANLKSGTLSLIHKARSLNIPVIMATRNSERLTDRFFAAKPELRYLFGAVLNCTHGIKKSEPIKHFLDANNIDPKTALFVDDMNAERTDVAENTEGVCSIDPNVAGNIELKEADQIIKKRRKIKRVIESELNLPNADHIKLAA